MRSVYVGQSIDVTIICKNRADELVDATALTCRVRKPSGTRVAYTYGTDAQLIRLSVGTYRLTVTVDQSRGWWFYGEFTYSSGGLTVNGVSPDYPVTVLAPH